MRILFWTILLLMPLSCANRPSLRIVDEHQERIACDPPTDLDAAYHRGVRWQSQPQGLVSTGVLGVPFDRATLKKDLVVSNGNDVSPQPITIYYARRDAASTAFPSYANLPEWVSERHAMHGQIASGDIDRDGLLDLVSAVIVGHPVTISATKGVLHPTGGIVVYKGIAGCPEGRVGSPDCLHRPTLSSEPEDSVSGFSTLSVSLGDVNGDGWLDLATGALIESGSPVELPRERPKGPWRIYLNDHGRFDWSHPITSKKDFNTTDLELADVDLDGRLDLVMAASRDVYVFLGKDAADGSRTISRNADWSSDPSGETNDDPAMAQFIASIDIGLLNPSVDSASTIAVSLTCLESTGPCDGRYLLYRPDRGRHAFWQYAFEGWGGELRFRDMNEDCLTDLVAGSWWSWDPENEQQVPGQLRVFTGDGSSLSSKPTWTSQIEGGFVGQAIELSDLSCDAVTVEAARFVSPGTSVVLTIPDSNIESIYRVRTGSGADGRILDPSEFTFAVGESWVAVPATPRGTPIRIDYIRSTKPDIVTGTFDFHLGVQLYERVGYAPRATCIPEDP